MSIEELTTEISQLKEKLAEAEYIIANMEEYTCFSNNMFEKFKYDESGNFDGKEEMRQYKEFESKVRLEFIKRFMKKKKGKKSGL